MTRESIERVAMQLKIFNVAILVFVVMLSTTCVLGMLVQQGNLKKRVEQLERKKPHARPSRSSTAHPGMDSSKVSPRSVSSVEN